MQLYGDISDERYSGSSLGDTSSAVVPRGSHPPQPHYFLKAKAPHEFPLWMQTPCPELVHSL